MRGLFERRRRRRGVALADFIAGTLILAGTMTAFMSLTQAKFDALRAGEARLRALTVAETALDTVRAQGLPARPAGLADPDGFRKVGDLELTEGLPNGEARLEARALRMEAGETHALYEARVVVRWSEQRDTYPEQVVLSTLVTLPEEGQ